ncbi:MAG: hypothetical protein GKR91_19475 [Pseudomonadales bacterium]|nr:hypothetical protein [Pseudomonadales bacterium]
MNYISKLVFCLSSLLPVLAFGQLHAPASFGSYADEFVSKLDFPNVSGGSTLTVKCAGRITDRGKFGTIICLDDPDFNGDSSIPRDVGSEIARMAQDVRVNPARVDGRRVEVWYNFSVRFQLKNGAEHIEIIDNHFRNKDNYGDNYVGAQRYNGDMSSCARNLRGAVFLQASISEGGEVQNVSQLGNSSSGGSCAGQLVEDMQSSAYIPAFFEGNPVASTYVEIFTKTD